MRCKKITPNRKPTRTRNFTKFDNKTTDVFKNEIWFARIYLSNCWKLLKNHSQVIEPPKIKALCQQTS